MLPKVFMFLDFFILILQSQDATFFESNHATFRKTMNVRIVSFQLACGQQKKSTLTCIDPLFHMKMLCHQDAWNY